MNINAIGKFEMRAIVTEFERALIQIYGMNMLDAAVSRYEALCICAEAKCPRRAAALWGTRRGLDPLPA